MFIGYEIKSNQNQAKPFVLETDIKLSQAVLDPASVKNKNKEPVSLVAEYNKKQFIVAVLDPSQSWQCPLDLMFSAGSQLKFFIRGAGTVHLTGFEHPDDMDDLDMSMSDSDDFEIDSDQAEAKPIKAKVGSAKKLENGSAKKGAQTNGKSPANKAVNGKAKPKMDDDEHVSGDSDDDSDDESFDFEDGEDDDEDGSDLELDSDEEMDDDSDLDDEEDSDQDE